MRTEKYLRWCDLHIARVDIAKIWYRHCHGQRGNFIVTLMFYYFPFEIECWICAFTWLTRNWFLHTNIGRVPVMYHIKYISSLKSTSGSTKLSNMGIILKPGHKTIIYLPPLSLSDLIKQLTGYKCHCVYGRGNYFGSRTVRSQDV